MKEEASITRIDSSSASGSDNAAGVFQHVVCTVDGSAEAAEAARQAALLLAPQGRLDVVAVADLGIAVHGGWAMAKIRDEIESDARLALERAAQLRPADSSLYHGEPVRCLLDHLHGVAPTVVAVGARRRSRVAGVLLGNVATALLHDAPCSVFVGRAVEGGGRFPQRILVGIDGSREAAVAGKVALDLSRRFDAECVGIVAIGGKKVDLAAARSSFDGSIEEFPASPATALAETSPEADLLVVGSRGLHGVSALGSVSERVAHRARCSVLVVRPEPGPAKT